MRKNKGITLIALIVTIIIMLILVGVTITMLTGKNGILNQGNRSIKETYHGTVKDQIILGANQYQIDKRTNSFNGDVIEYLNTNKYTTKVEGFNYYRVDVEKVAKNVKTGKGTTKTNGDIYVIEEYNDTSSNNVKVANTIISDVQQPLNNIDETKQYVLRYYEKEDNSKILLYLLGNGSTVDPEPTPDPEPDPDEENYDKVISVKKIEDLLDVAMYVENGQKNILVKLESDLDFTNKDDYREPDKYYKNPITGNRISLDSLKEVTVDGGSQGADDSDTVNDSYPSTSSVYLELNNPGGPTSPGFIQIGSSSEKAFDGMFKGNGHTLKNIYMSGNLKFNNNGNTTKNIIGLIGYNSGTIKDLNIEDIETYSDNSNTNSINNTGISSQVDTAILVVNNSGVIQNCNVNIKEITFTQTPPKTFGVIACNNTGIITECSIEGESCQSYYIQYMGGIAGINNGTIMNCTNDISTFKLTNEGTFIAGIVGQNNGQVSNCINNSNVISSSNFVAGIVGQNNKKVEKCTNTGTLSSTVFASGIICMNNSEEEISDCVNGIKDTENQLVDDSSKSYFRAGIVSYPTGKTLKIKNCINYMVINSYGPGASAIAMEPISGGTLENVEIKDCINNGKGTGSSGVAGIMFLGSSKSAIIKIDNCENNAEISSTYSSGIFRTYCDVDGTVTINNCTNNGNIIGDRTGGIIGGTVISGTGKINILNSYNYGTIGENSNYERVGGIVSSFSNNINYNIDSCENYANITGGRYVGGIIGEASNSGNAVVAKVANCKNKGIISGDSYTGGIIGYECTGGAQINNCINEKQASIISSSYAGGIIGWANRCFIINCENNADITTSSTGYNGTGGIIGYSYNIWVDNCKNTGKVTGTDNTGGIAGWIQGPNTETGNLGFNNCFNLGEISGKKYSAGIVGYVTVSDHNITNCGNNANIIGTNYVSGISPNNFGAKIVNCYNTGNITGNSKVSGIASNVGRSEVRNVYNTGIISTGTSTILGNPVDENISNLYSLIGVASEYITCSTSGDNYPDGTVTVMDETTMKSQSFVNTLNANKGEYGTWVIDASNENNGYPILSK